MKKYCFRFFYTLHGDFLWSGNEITKEKYGYPVNIERLPVTEKLKKEINDLGCEYSTSVDWSDPGGPSLWTQEKHMHFHNRLIIILNKLREELGKDYCVLNELSQTLQRY